MEINEIIEEMVSRELKSLCVNCMHVNTCVYHRTSAKAIIQCELFEMHHEQIPDQSDPKGLCSTCDNADRCALPGRKYGVWRCNEFN